MVTLDGSTVTGNESRENGGGILDSPGRTVTLNSGSTLTGNEPLTPGGGILNDSGTVTP